MPTDYTEKVRQNRLRRAAARRGYRLEGSRALGAEHPERGRWRLVKASEMTSTALFTLTLDDVERWLEGTPGRRPPVRSRRALPHSVHVGTAIPAPGTPDREIVSAVSGLTKDLMREVLDLWTTPADVIMDVTAGRFSMWPDGRRPAIAHDLHTIDGVDLRHLPEADASVDVVVLDPPFRPSLGGDALHYRNAYRSAESAPQTLSDVLDLYEVGLIEARRVLRPGGRVIVKCQDMTVSGLRLVLVDLLVLLDKTGFEMADHLVLLNESRLPASKGVQRRARRAHSHLLVGSVR